MIAAPAPIRPVAVRASVLSLLALVLAAPAFAQIDLEAVRARQRSSRQQQYAALKATAEGLPKLSAKRIEEVFQVRQEGKRLVCVTPALDVVGTNTRYRLNVEGFDGPTYIHTSLTDVSQPQFPFPAQGNAKQLPQPQPAQRPVRTFNLTSYEMPNADTLITTSVQSYPTSFQIDQTTQFNTDHSMIRLAEQRNAGLPDLGSIQLWVIQSSSSGRAPVSISVQEPDFATLLRNHPNEVETYVRPLMRQLGQEHMFAPDWRMAWQVLADYWQPDDGVGKQVASVLPGLDDADFRRREQAVAELVQLDRAAAVVLRRMNRTGLSAEQNRLVDLTLAPYHQLSPREASRLRNDKNFLLDCLYSDDAAVRKAAIAQLRKVTARTDLAYEPEAPLADRAAAASKLRRELSGKRPAETPGTQPATKPG
jgi:hypothetical protein